jgi:hypothetical protein
MQDHAGPYATYLRVQVRQGGQQVHAARLYRQPLLVQLQRSFRVAAACLQLPQSKNALAVARVNLQCLAVQPPCSHDVAPLSLHPAGSLERR